MRRSNWQTVTTTKTGECTVCKETIPPNQIVRWHPSPSRIVHFSCAFPDGIPAWAERSRQAHINPTPQATSPQGKTRTMNAKFPSKCKACGGAIAVGEPILWTPGVKGARHAECPTN